WGVIETNYLQGAGGGSGTVRREVSVVDSLVTGYQAGGVLFDGARGADGTPESAARAGITQYGYVTRSKIIGSANNAALAQTGIRYFAGVRGAVTDSTIQDNAAFSTVAPIYASYGIFLSDSENGNDPDNPAVRALTVTGNTFINNRIGLYNADLAGTAVRLGAPVAAGDNYWGCAPGPIVGGNSVTTPGSANYGCQGVSGADTTPAPSVELPSFRATVPATLNVPVATPDAPPSAVFVDPIGIPELEVGDILEPVVVATDDFGIKSVTLKADGQPVATLTKAPYEFGWSPTAADAGKTITLTATATDSSGQTDIASIDVEVEALPVDPPVLVPPVNVALPVITGDATVGQTVTCLPGVWNSTPTAFTYEWLLAGSPIGGATSASYEIATGDAASQLACKVTATNADGNVAATSTSKLVKTPAEPPTNTITTNTTIIHQVGSVLVTLNKSVKVSPTTGKVAIGQAVCAKASTSACTITVNSAVKIGGKSTKLTPVVLTGDGAKNLTLVLPSSARKALKKKKTGTIAISITASDVSGFYGSWKQSLSIKRK
ncbi:MAG: Ig-like domain-containing protein, partial [Solirubrobacterales bacterium]